MISAPLNLAQKQARAERLEPWEARLRELRRSAKASHAALMRAWEERNEIRAELQALEAYVSQMTETRTVNPQQQPDPPNVASARLDLDYGKTRLAELDAEIARAEAAWKPQIELVGRAEEWLEQHAARLCSHG